MNLAFLIGCPRSGTTFLLRHLIERYGFRSMPETHYFSLVLKNFWRKYKDVERLISPGDYEKMASLIICSVDDGDRSNGCTCTARPTSKRHDYPPLEN